MQEQPDPSQSQFSAPPQVPMAQPQGDLLAQASEAIDAVIVRTQANPNARMQEIAQIRAGYIKSKFGVDIAQ